MYKILIIEDNIKIRTELSVFLTRNGYECLSPDHFDNLAHVVQETAPHLVLLDINLPVVDGYYVCREIRKRSEVPIIVVTSRDSELDELTAMSLGADDFVTKPYNTQILLMRIASVLKRVYKEADMSEQVISLGIGDCVLVAARSAMVYQGQETSLTRNELKILALLHDHRGSIVSRDELMIQLWDSEIFVDDNTLTVNINRLRKKLDDAGLADVIETRRSLGYILR